MAGHGTSITLTSDRASFDLVAVDDDDGTLAGTWTLASATEAGVATTFPNPPPTLTAIAPSDANAQTWTIRAIECTTVEGNATLTGVAITGREQESHDDTGCVNPLQGWLRTVLRLGALIEVRGDQLTLRGATGTAEFTRTGDDTVTSSTPPGSAPDTLDVPKATAPTLPDPDAETFTTEPGPNDPTGAVGD